MDSRIRRSGRKIRGGGGVVLAGVVLLVASAPTLVLASDDDHRPSIRTVGRAELDAPPDLAHFRVSVVSRDAELKGAASDNARRSKAVMKALHKVVGETGDLQTQGFAVSPRYRWNDGEQVQVGYEANNIIRVELRDLERVGEATAAALDAGADQITGLHFTLEEDTGLRAKALALAAGRAREKADAMAEALGVKILRVIGASEGGVGRPRPMPEMRRAMMAEADSEAPPVEPGPVKVAAEVALRVEISD